MKAFILLLAASLFFAEPKADSGFTLLFNGKDFSGWKMNKTNEPLEGKTDAGKMRFIAKDGILMIDPKAKGDLTINTVQDFEKMYTSSLNTSLMPSVTTIFFTGHEVRY